MRKAYPHSTKANLALDTFESENALFVHREEDAKPKAKTA